MTFPSNPVHGTLSTGGRFTYVDPPGMWKIVGDETPTSGGSSSLESSIAAIQDSVSSLETTVGGNTERIRRQRTQVTSPASGDLPIDLSQGVFVHVSGTDGPWSPAFTNVPNEGVEVYLSVNVTNTNDAMTFSDGAWKQGTTPPAPGDFGAGDVLVFRFVKLPNVDKWIMEWLFDGVAPLVTPDPITPPTLAAFFNTPTTRNTATALAGATLPPGEVIVWFGPNSPDVVEMRIFCNHSGAIPAEGAEGDSFVGTRTTWPYDLLGSGVDDVIFWDTNVDPTGNNRSDYDQNGPTSFTIERLLTDGQRVSETISFNTGNAPAGSAPVVDVQAPVVYSSGGAGHPVTLPDGVDRSILVHVLYRNVDDEAITGLNLVGNGTTKAMTILDSDWRWNTQFFGCIVAKLDEADLSTGTFTIEPVWAPGGPASVSMISYQVTTVINGATPTFGTNIVWENSAADRAPLLASVPANSIVITGSSQSNNVTDQTFTGFTPTTLFGTVTDTSSWIDMDVRVAYLLDSGVEAPQMATWDVSGKGHSFISYINYGASAGGGSEEPIVGDVPVISGVIAGDNQLTVNWGAVSPPEPSTTTYDVIIDTDLGGDPDDIQSLVRLCHYSDVLKVKAIVSTKPVKTEAYDRFDFLLEWIRRADLDHLRSRGYTNLMTEAEMLATAVRGNQNTDEQPGPGKNTAGSDRIIAVANDPVAAYDRDTNPLWVLVWGTPGSVAQALYDDPTISTKIRLYTIGQFNSVRWTQATGWDNPLEEHQFIQNFLQNTDNNLWWVNNGELPFLNTKGTFKGTYTGGNQTGEWDPITFLNQNIRGHGTDRNGTYAQITGDAFPGAEGPADIVGGLKEGDSPTMLYLLSPLFGGTGDVDDPTQESWGGQFRRPNAASYPNYYVDLSDNSTAQASISKWRVAFLSHWKDRWDRYQSSAAVSYEIRWGTTNPPSNSPVSTLSTSRVITGLAAGVSYYVQVRSVSSTGDRSSWSVVGSGTPTGTVAPPPTFSGKFEVTNDPYEVSMTEGNQGMKFGDLWVPTAYRRVNVHTSEYGQANIVNSMTTGEGKDFVLRWENTRKTPFQAADGPRLFITCKPTLADDGNNHNRMDSATRREGAARSVYDMGVSGSKGSINRDQVWLDLAASINRTYRGWDLRKAVFLSISHENNGPWSGGYWGINPAIVGQPLLTGATDSQFGPEMGAALRHAGATGEIMRVHRAYYEHVVGDLINSVSPNIICGLSPAGSRSSVPVGEEGSSYSVAWFEEALPDASLVDFLFPTEYFFRGRHPVWNGVGSNTDPLQYDENTNNWLSIAIDTAVNRFGCPFGTLEFGGEYTYANNPGGIVPGGSGSLSGTDLENEMGYRRYFDHVLPSVSTGLGMINHWFFLTTGNSNAGANHSFHILEGCWGAIKPPLDGATYSFDGTGRPPSSSMTVTPPLTPQYPRCLDWFKEEFNPNKLA